MDWGSVDVSLFGRNQLYTMPHNNTANFLQMLTMEIPYFNLVDEG